MMSPREGGREEAVWLGKTRYVWRAVMKAIRVHEFGGPEVLKLEEVPRMSPGPNEALIQVKAVGVNPVETYIRAGTYARKPPLPFTPGNDAAGVVVEVGSGVSTFKPGDKVYTTKTISGAYAECSLVTADSLHLIPGSLSFAEAAALPTPYLTAFRGLIQRGRARASDTVLIHGASGGVGVAAVQFARAYGMTVFGTAGTDQGLDIVKQAGAHMSFNHREKGYTAWMLSATANHGFNVIVENAAHINLGRDLEMLSPGGCVAVVGSRGPIQVNPRDAMSREASVVGVMLFQASDRELADAHAAIRGGAEAGWLKPIVGKQYPLSEAAAAHKEIMEGSGTLGKMVLVVE